MKRALEFLAWSNEQRVEVLWVKVAVAWERLVLRLLLPWKLHFNINSGYSRWVFHFLVLSRIIAIEYLILVG